MLEHVKESEDKYKTHKRMLGMLTVISEVRIDYYIKLMINK